MLIVGLILNTLIALSCLTDPDDILRILAMIMLTVSIAQWIAFAVYSSKRSTGVLNFIKWSSILWTPIGLVAVIGAKKIQEKEDEAAFHARREQTLTDEFPR